MKSFVPMSQSCIPAGGALPVICMLVPVNCPAEKLSVMVAQLPVVPPVVPVKLYAAVPVELPIDAVTTPPAAAAMLVSGQLCVKVQVAGAWLGGMQLTEPVGVVAGAGE